jgi:hypothetical protein
LNPYLACDRYQLSWCSVQARPNVTYNARGMLPLSYPCNYYDAGQALGLDLFNDPDIVSQSNKLAALTAIWYFTATGLSDLAQQGDFTSTIRRLNEYSCLTSTDYHMLLEQVTIYYEMRQCFNLLETIVDLPC